MRRGELLKLTAADVNLELRHVVARDTKNGRTRKVPLSARAMQVLDALIEAQSAEERHCDEPLLGLTPNMHKKIFFNRVIPKSRIVDLHFHDLRHEAISRMAQSGKFQLIELQAISGHRDMRMLQRYAHLCSRQLAEKLDDMKLGTTTHYLHRGRKRTVVKAEVLADGRSCAAVVESPQEPPRTTAPSNAQASSSATAPESTCERTAEQGRLAEQSGAPVGATIIHLADFTRTARRA